MKSAPTTTSMKRKKRMRHGRQSFRGMQRAMAAGWRKRPCMQQSIVIRGRSGVRCPALLNRRRRRCHDPFAADGAASLALP